MVKASIKNPEIGIRPSERLIEFIKTLSDPTIDLPENLLTFYRAFSNDTKSSRSICKQSIPEYKFSKEEQQLLTELSDDALQGTNDLEKSLNELCVLSQCTDSSDESDAELLSSDEPISKNKARQMRAKQRQKELSNLNLSLTDLKWIHTHLNEARKSNPTVGYLHELIKGSHLVLPINEFTERDPALEARCQRLKREQDDLRYRMMTKNVDCSRTYEPEETIAYQGLYWIKSDKSRIKMIKSIIHCVTLRTFFNLVFFSQFQLSKSTGN